MSVDLWYVQTRDVRDPALVLACTALLTEEEARKQQAFLFENNRHEYLVTRALGRLVLAHTLGATPGSLTFERNAYGRPELVPPTVRFNLTNTVELVACVVASDREVGVDAEPLSRGDDILEIAETVFTARELASLACLALPQRRRRAVDLWTLKEAYIKARGIGMSLPVQDIELDVQGDSAQMRFHDGVVDDPARWELSTRPIDDHIVATCIESGGAVSVRRADLRQLLLLTPS